ncbi:GGDEF domain-containing protein, partial [Alteromonas macleodii]
RARYIGGTWQEITSPFSIRVLPSIYQTFAFKFSVFLFFCFVIYALYKVRFHHLKKSEMILKQRVDEQTRSLELQTKRFEFQATHDDLTGIANRRAFDRWLVQYFEEAKAKQSPLCLAVIDIDHFKQVNDQYSHLVGDKVITEVARILNREVPHYAKCARWGGEEFTVLLPEYDLVNARVAMDHVRKIVAAHDFSFIAQTLKVTISIGVASADGARDHDRMLTHADQALYTAKENGRNQVTIFE